MNVFVLSAGRTGTMSLEKACTHIDNYTCSHESRCTVTGPGRLHYPQHHIEIDNRLSWFLGRLHEAYGNNAIYIHMKRNPEKIAKSYAKRWNRETGIIRAYGYGILKRQEHQIGDPLEISRDYVETVNSNITNFLRDKSKTMVFELENASRDLERFWQLIQASGDYEKSWRHLQTVIIRAIEVAQSRTNPFINFCV